MISSVNLSIYLPARWKKIIEETTKRLFKSLQQKIKTIEQTISSVETLINDDAISSSSLSDSDEDIQIVNAKNKNNLQQPQNQSNKLQNQPLHLLQQQRNHQRL
ncbi:unnamed protein product [Rotaria socialis]|uniref:Uncharacterized protein n=1 Tax=Rotaria socialis TaxID=392032 RepID=A0A818PZ76_9BILA|nr:unnamed protein product [Rotaria socialis]